MKKQVLGFVNIAQLIDNTPLEVCPLGELTTWSRTYSKHKGEYSSTSFPGFMLTTFSVVDAATDIETELTAKESELPMAIAKACMEYAATHTSPLNSKDFIATIQAEFFEDLQNLDFGDLISAANTTLPAWFSYDAKDGDNNVVRIWLADNEFQAEYPGNETTVVSPLVDPNNFLIPWDSACKLINDRPMTVLMEDLQNNKNLNPETFVRYLEVDFVNQTNPTQKIKVSWFVLIYGLAGDHEDNIKSAIVDFLVKGTGQDEEVWVRIFPELFARSEHMIFPQWQNTSIPNMSILTGLYSPFTNTTKAISFIKANTQTYTRPWIDANTTIFPILYKSISIASVDGQNNAVDSSKLSDTYKDYIIVQTTDPDFQRMSEVTKGWVLFMNKIIAAAETATSTSTLPTGIRRIKQDDRWYLTGTYNKDTFKVYQRNNPNTVIPE